MLHQRRGVDSDRRHGGNDAVPRPAQVCVLVREAQTDDVSALAYLRARCGALCGADKRPVTSPSSSAGSIAGSSSSGLATGGGVPASSKPADGGIDAIYHAARWDRAKRHPALQEPVKQRPQQPQTAARHWQLPRCRGPATRSHQLSMQLGRRRGLHGRNETASVIIDPYCEA